MALALAAWGAAVGLAFWAQAVLDPVDLARGTLIYALAAALGSIAVALIDRYAPSTNDAPPEGLVTSPGGRSRRSIAIGIVAGVAATTLSVAVLAISGNQHVAVLLWFVGLILPTATLSIGTRTDGWFQRPRLVEAGAVCAILVVAIFLRVPDLTEIPPEVHGDEAACGLEARKILSGEMPAVFGFGWYDVPNPSFAISAASMWIFGDDLFGFRMASVLQGLASILFLYLIVRRLFSARAAFLAAFFLAVSHWHIHFSRSGIHYVQATFATTLLLYVLVLALQRRQLLYFLLTGFAAGLCSTVYYAARLAPLLAVWVILYELLRHPSQRRYYAAGFFTLVLGAVLFVAPFSVPAARNPKAVLSRGEGVFVLTDENLRHSKDFYQVDSTAGVLGMQVVNTLSAFNARGDRSGQHHHPAPLIDFYVSALFVLGVAAAAWRWHEMRYFLLNSWFWGTLMTGAILTIDPVFSPRLAGVLPALFIFPALVVDAGWRGTERLLGRLGSGLFAIPVVLLLVLSVRANYRDYFELHIKKLQTANFYTAVARHLQRVNDRYRVDLVGKPDGSVRQYTIRFLVPDADAADLPIGALQLPLDRVPPEKGISFVVDAHAQGAEDDLAALRKAYPSGATESHEDTKGYLLFYTHTVDHAALLAANPNATVESEEENAAKVEPGEVGVPVDRARAKVAWSRLPDKGEVRGVAVSPGGDVYGLDRSSATIVRLGSDGRVERSITLHEEDDGTNAPAVDVRAIAVGPNEHVFVLDSSRNKVYELAADGKRIGTVRLPGGYFPSGIAVDSKGMLLIADTGESRIVRLRSDGTAVVEFGRDGENKGKLDQPTAVVAGADGEIFVADVGHSRIAVFGPDLSFRRQWAVPHSGTLQGTQLVLGSDAVFVSDPEGRRVIQYDREGRQLDEIGVGELSRPIGLALDERGNLYVADAAARAIFRYATREEKTS